MIEHWQSVLLKNWGIDARLKKLDGEYDLNFLAQDGEGRRYVLKVMRSGNFDNLVDLQTSALQHIRNSNPTIPVPSVIKSMAGGLSVVVGDDADEQRTAWLMECLDGGNYVHLSPKSSRLINDLGRQVGAMDKALEAFDHPSLQRDFKWNLMSATWIRTELDSVTEPHRRAILKQIVDDFENVRPRLAELPKVAIHNDVNDYNILVTGTVSQEPGISGIVDFGDMCAAPRVCELGIAGAYVVLDQLRPHAALAAFVSGYHASYPLLADEIELIWPLLRMRLAVSVVNSTLEAARSPDDPYVVISQAPAWRFLETDANEPDLMSARLRMACGLPVTETARKIQSYLEGAKGTFAPVLNKDLANVPMVSLSADSSSVPQNPFDLTRDEAAALAIECSSSGGMCLGFYREPRMIYTDYGG